MVSSFPSNLYVFIYFTCCSLYKFRLQVQAACSGALGTSWENRRCRFIVHTADLSALVAADVVMAFPFTRSSTATGILPVEAPDEATLGQPGDEVSGSLFSWDFLEFRQ